MPRPPRFRSAPQMATTAEGFDDKVEHRDQIFQHMQDIFENQIEAEVIHMVLGECDWEEEKSMDMLLSICQNCSPQTREVTEPDLALIACSLIDQTTEVPVHSDLEDGAVASSLPVISEPIQINTNDDKHKLKLFIESRRKGIISCSDQLCQNSPTEELNTDLTSPFLTEDVKDITLQSYMSVYLDDVDPHVPSKSLSVLKEKDKTNSVLKPLLTQSYDGREVSDKTNCVLKPLLTQSFDSREVIDKTDCVIKPLLTQSFDSREVIDKTDCVIKPLLQQSTDDGEDNVTDNRYSSLDSGVIDPVMSSGGGNPNMCLPDNLSSDMISLNTHDRSDTFFVTDETSVHNPLESKSLKKTSKMNKTFSSVEKMDHTCSCTSEKIDKTCSSPFEEIEKTDVVISSSLGESSKIDPCLSSLVREGDSCSSVNPLNCGENSQSCKMPNIDTSENSSFSEMKDNISEKTTNVSCLDDKTGCEHESQKGSSFFVSHLSSDAPEFIPSFKPSSQKPYQFEGNPVFFTPKGPKYRGRNKTPPTWIPPHYPYQPGVAHHRHRLPLRQIMLKPIPVTSLESQTFSQHPGKSNSVFSTSGKNTGKPDAVLSTSGTSQPLYSQATSKNHNGSVLTSRTTSSHSKESSVACRMDAEINRVKKYLDRTQLLMVILRGLPGSGKSTLANELKFDGVVLTTDEYFMRNGHYEFDVTMLSDAHAWTKTKAMKAMENKINPLIIDNTNTQLWEMIPYVKLALTYNYEIEIIEPNTPWKGKPAQLAKRNTHGVSKEGIKRMKQRYEYNITVKSIIASVKDSDRFEKQRETEDLRPSTKTNDLSLPSKKQFKEPCIITPAPLNQPKMFSSYTSLLKSTNQSKITVSTKVKRNSTTKNKTKDTQRQTNVVQQQKDLQSVPEMQSIKTYSKDYQCGLEKPNIVQNEDYQVSFEKPNIQNEENQDVEKTNVQNEYHQGGFQKSNIQNKDYSSVPKTPKFHISEKDEVISTLEDFLKHGNIKKMTEKDWRQREEELNVLLQLSPVDPKERQEISQLLGYRMKQMRGFNGLSENESESNFEDRSHNDDIPQSGAEDDNLGSVRSLATDCNSGFQKSQVEHKFKNLHNSTEVQDGITPECMSSLNNITEKDIVNNLIDKSSNSNKHCTGLLTEDIPIESMKTGTSLYPLNIDNSTRTNSKTNLSRFNLNSESKHKEMKMSKQKDVTSPLLDVSSFMDFSENKESMIEKKQEVSDKAIIFTKNMESVFEKKQDVSDEPVMFSEPAPVSTVDNDSCSLGINRTDCDASLNIFLSEAETDHSYSDKQSSPLSKECDDDSSMSSSKPKRKRRKKRNQVFYQQTGKNDVNLFHDSKSDISPVPKLEAGYWASSVMKNPISEKLTVVEVENVSWNLECQKPKPQRPRRHSEQSVQSSENSSSEKLDTDNVEVLTETEIEQQTVQPDDTDVMGIVEKDLLNDVEQEKDVKGNYVVSGGQVNIDSETCLSALDHDHIEESLSEQEQSFVGGACSSVQEDTPESDDSCKNSFLKPVMSTGSGIQTEIQETDESSQEPVVLNKEMINAGKEDRQTDDSTGTSLVTQKSDEVLEEPATSSKALMDADVMETLMSDSTQKISKMSKPKHKKGAMFSSPFLDISAKQKFETLNWSNFAPVQGPCSNVVNIEVKEYKKVSCRTHWTVTKAKDFNVLDSLNRGFNISKIKNADNYTILLGKSRCLNQNLATKSNCNADDCISTKLPLDKSTMTDDFQSNLDQDIEFLKHSFPDISEHQLWEVLTMCQKDVEWSVNLLLDWGVYVPLTSDDKQEIAEEMLKLKQIVSPEKVNPQLALLSADQCLSSSSSSSSSSPLSLFDLCYGIINSKHLVNSKELEQCLIKDSYKRLQRMESHNREQMLSISYDESLSQAEIDDFQECSKDLQNETDYGGSLSSSSSDSNLLLNSVTPSVFPTGVFATGETTSGRTLPVKSATSEGLSARVEEHERLASGIEIGSEQEIATEDDDRIVLHVPRTLVEVLESLFGPAECRHEAEDEFEVSLDLDSAKLIHSCLQRRRMPSKSVLKQLKDDEAMARRLQHEERVGSVKPHYRHTGALVIDVEPHYQRGGVNPVRHTKKEPPVKLMDIMKEEKDKNLLIEEQQRVLEESGDHIAIATKLKRQKLYHIFPGVDENFLEEIFQANGFSLEDTVCVIQNCLGSKSREKFDDTATEMDEKLLEQTKQLSRQTLVNCSLNLLDQSKEFQDVPDETDSLPSYSELRAEGTLHHQLRDDCFSKAQQAYRRGMKDVACFYSQQGHLHTQKLKEAHMRASQKLLESRNELLVQQSTLDLHGFHVNEAISTLKNILEQREIEFQIRPDRKKQSLVIVTGRGRHSQGGVAKVRPAVANFLNNTGYRYMENPVGVFKVQLRYRPIV